MRASTLIAIACGALAIMCASNLALLWSDVRAVEAGGRPVFWFREDEVTDRYVKNAFFALAFGAGCALALRARLR